MYIISLMRFYFKEQFILIEYQINLQFRNRLCAYFSAFVRVCLLLYPAPCVLFSSSLIDSAIPGRILSQVCGTSSFERLIRPVLFLSGKSASCWFSIALQEEVAE